MPQATKVPKTDRRVTGTPVIYARTATVPIRDRKDIKNTNGVSLVIEKTLSISIGILEQPLIHTSNENNNGLKKNDWSSFGSDCVVIFDFHTHPPFLRWELYELAAHVLWRFLRLPSEPFWSRSRARWFAISSLLARICTYSVFSSEGKPDGNVLGLRLQVGPSVRQRQQRRELD